MAQFEVLLCADYVSKLRRTIVALYSTASRMETDLRHPRSCHSEKKSINFVLIKNLFKKKCLEHITASSTVLPASQRINN